MTVNNQEAMILQLPNELLMKIIEFVPERFDISMVCVKFHEIVCTLDRKSHKIALKDENTVSGNSKLLLLMAHLMTSSF